MSIHTATELSSETPSGFSFIANFGWAHGEQINTRKQIITGVGTEP